MEKIVLCCNSISAGRRMGKYAGMMKSHSMYINISRWYFTFRARQSIASHKCYSLCNS